MMGRTHATSGAVLSLMALPLLRQAHVVPPDPISTVAVVIAGAGGAMLPDLDHRHATVARSLPPVSNVAAVGVEKLAGGHRNGTHSLLGVAVFVLIAQSMNRLAAPLGTASGWLGLTARLDQLGGAELWGRIGLGLWLAFLFAVATAALRLQMQQTSKLHMVICLTVGVALVWTSAYTRFPTAAIPWAVGIGAASHILTDMLTKEGCPLAWPVLKTRVRMARITTDSPTERILIAPMLGLALVVLVTQELLASGAWELVTGR